MAKKHVQVMEDVLAGRMEALPDEPDTLDAGPVVDDSAAAADAEPPPAPEISPSLGAPEAQGTEPTPPKLDLKLDAEESHEPETPDAEPEWLGKQPEDVQKYVRELRSAREGQRHAYARRAEQVKTLQERLTKAELERRQAIHLALEGRKAQTAPTAPEAPAKEAPRKGIPVTIDENTGEASVDPAVLERLVDERARQIVGAHSGQQGAESARISTVDRMVSDAGISQQTQEALFYAAQDTLELVRQAAALEGREVRGVADAKVLLRKHGAEPILQRKYPGLTIHDVYDVIEGSSDPDGHGHRLVEVAQRAQSRWFGQAPAQNGVAPAPRPSGPPKTPRPIGDHPASMASRGPGTNPTNARSRATLDEIVAMNDMDKVLNMDQKEKDELWRRWDAEMGETPAGFSR